MTATGTVRAEDLGPALLGLFETADDIYVFVKDADRRFTACTTPFARLLGFQQPQQLIGLRDEDVSPDYLAEHYRKNDEELIANGGRLVDAVELVRNVDGSYGWYLTTKSAIVDDSGVPTGLVGQTRPFAERRSPEQGIRGLTGAIEVISKRYAEPISVVDMANAVSMSTSNFNRAFRSHFGTTPYQYLRGVRLMAAADLLSTTALSLAEIASRTGFYDSSHLARTFREDRGITPAGYRRASR
ncbi:helix-turn-helix domain-containing protein [uncultured Amnibacterium sp.]|uniref:helix-turn-helix domain-containing protein n=1 Tax=uncultured Amnibacterium sp. TaxID=1631851 RepID=UPI0035CA02A6